MIQPTTRIRALHPDPSAPTGVLQGCVEPLRFVRRRWQRRGTSGAVVRRLKLWLDHHHHPNLPRRPRAPSGEGARVDGPAVQHAAHDAPEPRQRWVPSVPALLHLRRHGRAAIRQGEVDGRATGE